MKSSTNPEISCRITKTLLMYVKENNRGDIGPLLHGLDLDENYLSDADNWVSHTFLQDLYGRMIQILQDKNAVYKMALASNRFQSLGILDRIGRLLGNPGLIYANSPKYNKLLKRNGDVRILERGDSHVLLEDCYHSSSQKTRYDCDYTRGIITGIPTIFELPFAEVEEIRCQVEPEKYGRRIWNDSPSHGVNGCLYRVRWDAKKQPPLWKRISRRYFIYRKAVEDLESANRKIQEKYEEARTLAASLELTNRQLGESKRQLESYMAELKSSEQRYRLLAENASDIIWTFDINTMHLTYISPSVTKLIGFTPEETISRGLEGMIPAEELNHITQEIAKELARDGKVGVDPHRSRTMEFTMLRRDGSHFLAEAKASFLRDGKGHPAGILGVTRDINERKRLEDERSDLEHRLQQAQKMEAIGTLAGGIAHDFNNLLMGIQGFTSLMMLDTTPDRSNYERLQHIQNLVKNGSHLTKQLLGFARAGRYELKPTDMNEVISKTAEIFSQTRKEIRIHLILTSSPPVVSADPGQMEQVLLNLYINAWQAMPSGGDLYVTSGYKEIEGRKSAPYNLPPGHYVMISVRDTGVGMSEEIIPRIFDPFFTTKEIGGERGTGLGLATVYGIVRAHGGSISVKSEVNEGTVFEICLPASDEEVRREKADFEPAPRGRENILIVDDEKLIADVTKELLESLGYRTMTARSGREAIDLYRKFKDNIDLVILDMVLPGMNGREIFEILAGINPSIKAIISSGYSMDGEAKRILDRGCRDFLQKPFDRQSLSQTVRKVLDSEMRNI